MRLVSIVTKAMEGRGPGQRSRKGNAPVLAETDSR